MKTKILKSMAGVMNDVALALVVQSANTACIWNFYQPEYPKEADKYKKDRK